MNRSPDETTLRVQAQQAALFALLKSGIPTADTDTAWKALTESTARTLGVRRVSIWLLSDDRQQLILQDLYDLQKGRHVNGTALQAQRYPAYFHALRWSRAIVAPDARTDPRTAEFGEEYLGANGIESMLDAGIWQAGEARGVVCLESVGARRTWTLDEQQFSGSIADVAAAVLDRETIRKAQGALEESRDLFERAVNSSPDWISVVRLSDGKILHLNEAFERESGHRPSDVIGRSSLEVGIWVDPAQRAAWVERIKAEPRVRDFEVKFRRKSGEIRLFQLSGERIEIKGEACVVTISRDVTDRRRQEQLVNQIALGVAAETGESFFRMLVAHLGEALGADMAFVGEIDPSRPGKVRTIAVRAGNKEAADFEYDLHGSPCETIVGRDVCAYPERAWELFPLDRALKEEGVEAYVGAPLSDARGAPLGLMAVLFRKPLADPALAENLLRIFAARASVEMERGHHLKALEHLAHHDPLTGLPNRILLRERIEAGLAGGAGALLLIDLDRFKEINDTLGHPVGDVLLASVGKRLASEMGESFGGQVARLGGDEFAIWIERVADPDTVERAAVRALAVLTAPFEIEGYRLEIGASIGIAKAPAHARTASGLLRCADVAMYEAKQQGAGYLEYDAARDPYSAQRLALLSELGNAVRTGEMEVHYQPRVKLADRSLSGFEALVRWRHPRLGMLPPAQFIPLAELSDVIRPLTLWVLEQALRQQVEWARGGRPVRISVNLSARHLLDDSCPEQIHRLLQAHATDPSALELEITESALIADPERAHATLSRIRALGVRVAVDDFGTGYSSLSHLKRLPLQSLKIDVSFIRHMLSSREDLVIVESTIALAHNLGLTVVAEGVETEQTLEALRMGGCDEAQGYHIAKPMDAAAAGEWMRQSAYRAA